MATSSLKKDFVIKSRVQISNLAKMMKEALQKPYEAPKTICKTATPEEARALLYGSRK